MATFLPSRSFADPIALPFFTATPVKSLPATPVEAMALETALTGTPLLRAISREVTLENPNWNCPPATPGTIAAPLDAFEIWSFSPRLS